MQLIFAENFVIKPSTFLLLFCLLLLAGCQPKVYLMPSPVGIQPGSDFYTHSPLEPDRNRLTTLYATNRIPNNLTGKEDRYTIFPSDDLRIGAVTHIVGKEDKTWEELYDKSLSREREQDPVISMKSIEELLYIDEEEDLEVLSPGYQVFFNYINDILARSYHKDITIYVHGANSNFYRATSQGAQYFHFTGHNSVLLTFSWPSAESIFNYKVDVLHARKTIPAFARLIQYLALHSKARHINILAYSAGAQVAAPGLVYLRASYPGESDEELKQRFRIGEVYFAAPDIELKSFAYRLNQFTGITERVTISANSSDSVLLHARRFTGKTRLGGRIEGEKISHEEKNILVEYSRTGKLDLIDIKGSPGLDVGRSHSFWYTHPWVSNDLLLLMIFNLPPEQRELVRVEHESGLVLYHFPEDYSQRIETLIEKMKTLSSSAN